MNDAITNYTFSSVIEDAKRVITNPVEFYRNMPTDGGKLDPIIFVAAIGAITGLLVAVLSLFSSFSFGGFAFGAIIAFPILFIIGSFIGGAILFVIWRLMGSDKDYETAFRCAAFAYAIAPIVVLLSIVPYIGGLIKTVWGCFLMYTASIEAHKIAASKAKLVFGILAAVGVLVGANMEHKTRNWQSSFNKVSSNANLKDIENMSAEEAGEKMGEFLKGLQKAAEEADKAKAAND